MDHVLQETDRNRQMANQIAHRTFTTHAFDNGAFPTGPKAWQSKGIRIEGCLLICEGSEYCSTCKEDPFDTHGARYLFPFSPESPHFEVLIQETGERRLLGLGVVGKNYGNHAMPGWLDGTVGYHIDDGKIFVDSTDGKDNEDAMAYRGDVIGCTVKFDLATNGKVPVVFSLNGRQITQEEIVMEYTPNEKSLFPYLGIGHAGIRVLAKMRSSDTCDVQPSTAGKDERAMEREQIMTILNKINNFKIETEKQVEKTNEVMKSAEFELHHSQSGRRRLFHRLTYGFEGVKDLLRGPLLLMDERRMTSPRLARRNLRDLCTKDELDHTEGVEPTNTELLEKISNKLAEIEEYTADMSDALLKRMECLKTDVKKQRDGLKDMGSYVEKEFSEVNDLIRKHCTTYKEEEFEEG